MADPRPSLARQSLDLLDQGSELLARLDAGTYSGEPAPGSGTVGQHFRHVLDFYARFLAGFEAAAGDTAPGGEPDVRYDARDRDPRVEHEPEVARQRALELAARLGRITPDDERCSAAVAHDRTDDSPRCASSVGRELLFLTSHTTHHYALIAVLLRLQGVEPGVEFGVATSTLEHRRRQPAVVRA